MQPVENAHDVKLRALSARPQWTQVCKWVETKIVYGIYYFEGYATSLCLFMICSNRGLRRAPHTMLLNHNHLNSIYSTRHQDFLPVMSQLYGISNLRLFDRFMLILKKTLKVCITCPLYMVVGWFSHTWLILCETFPYHDVIIWFENYYQRPWII